MFPFYRQRDAFDCGPTCVRMIAKYYKKDISVQLIREISHVDREGTSIKAIENAGKILGFNTLSIKSSINLVDPDIPLLDTLPLPLIAHWAGNHFVVIYKIQNGKVYFADPGIGLRTELLTDVHKNLYSNTDWGKVVLFEPTAFFYDKENPVFKNQKLRNNLSFIKTQLMNVKSGIVALLLFISVKLIIQSTAPLLTQKTFDSGIIGKNLNIIIVITVFQVFLSLFNSFIDYFENVASNKVSRDINYSLSNDFIAKIFRIPLSVLQRKNTSDFIYRINDLNKIESFLTYSFASLLLSLLSIIVLSTIILHYNPQTYFIYTLYSCVYVIWILYSLRKRKELNYEKFDIQISAHQKLVEMIEGMHDIKLNGNEQKKFDSFALTQKNLYRNSLQTLKRSQVLNVGGGLINNLGYGVITFYTSYLTINNQITIGEMAAIQLLVSQLNSPVSNILTSFGVVQELKFSMERILEIHDIEDEKTGDKTVQPSADITLDDLTFSYTEISTKVLRNVNLVIEANKTTAIVGTSGSGKTTLMKLILGLYKPTNGRILIDDERIEHYNGKEWRKKCGVVMQDGYLFTGTIIDNITESEQELNYDDYIDALKSACLYDFVMSLPIQHQTIIGKGGVALSSGQKQRMLIARMLYKKPEYVFMDEATNSLDAETERAIIDNMDAIFENKTRLVIAHRLNTVKNADKIVVLKDGRIIEEGNHHELIMDHGFYYELVKEQLQLS